MPRCPDGKQKVQKIGEHVDRTRDNQHHVSVDAVTLIKQVPDFVDWMALKNNRKQNGEVKGQVAPDQSVTGPVDGSRLHRCEDMYELE